MKIANGIDMLVIAFDRIGQPSYIYPTLIWDQDNAILIDTGFPGQLPLIRETVAKAGIPFDRVNRVIITHHDIDHIGGLAAIQKDHPVETLAYLTEKEYIEGAKTPLKLAQLQANLDNASEEAKATYTMLKAGFENSKARVDVTLTDGEILPYCGGVTVIHTPGHTLGHICLYLNASKTLVSGDELRIEDGVLNPAPARMNHDTPQAIQSIKKLTPYDIQRVVTYHGGLYEDQPNERIAELAEAKA